MHDVYGACKDNHIGGINRVGQGLQLFVVGTLCLIRATDRTALTETVKIRGKEELGHFPAKLFVKLLCDIIC